MRAVASDRSSRVQAVSAGAVIVLVAVVAVERQEIFASHIAHTREPVLHTISMRVDLTICRDCRRRRSLRYSEQKRIELCWLAFRTPANPWVRSFDHVTRISDRRRKPQA